MNRSSRTLNSIRNIATGFLGQFITTLLGFISRTIFIKFLSAEYLGVNGLFTNILSILSLAELGVGSAIIYALYSPLANNNKEKVSKLMNFYSKAYISIGILIGVCGILVLPFFDIIIKEQPNIKESLYLIYLIYLFNTSVSYFYSYKSSLIIADQKNYITSVVSYGVSIIQTILQITVLIKTKNFMVYLLVQTLCSLIYNITISKIADKMYPYIKENRKLKLDKSEKKGLISNIRALMIVKLSGVLVNNTDNLIITYFSGLSLVGLCSNYMMLIGIINTILNQIFSGITASVGNLNAKESVEKKEEFFNIINFCNFWLFGFSAIGIVVLIDDIISSWLGDKFILSNSITIILAVNFYMVGMQSAVWTYKNTLGIFRKGRYLLLVTAGINLIASMILGKIWGLFGILLSTAISRLLTNAWYDPYIVYKIGFKKDFKSYIFRYLLFILVLILAWIPTQVLCDMVILNSIFGLCIKFIICITVPNIIILSFFYKSKEVKYILNMIKILLSKARVLKYTQLTYK